LARRRRQPLLERTGLLQIGPADGAVIRGTLESARRHGLDVEECVPRQIARRWPQFRVDANWTGIWEPDAGLLRVEDCVAAHLEEAVAAGAELLMPATAGAWTVDATGVTVPTRRGVYRGRYLVVAAGAWAPGLLAEFGAALCVVRKPQYWIRVSEAFEARRGFPAFLLETNHGIYYGLPAVDSWGLKVARHDAGLPVDDPTALERAVDPIDRADVESFLTQHLPGAGTEWIGHAACMYTKTADGHFLVGFHPNSERVVLAVGMSGHGFKFAPVLGEATADLVLGQATELPVGFLAPHREGARHRNMP
jgi:glycine/D-amino acid oxidase-like deaminating enzyme